MSEIIERDDLYPATSVRDNANLNRKLLKKGEIDGVEYRIYTNGFFPLAYIENADGVDLYNEGSIVHGGFTWDDEFPGEPGVKWLGWDYGHAGDYSILFVGNVRSLYGELRVWTIDEIMEDVKRAIKALNEKKH